MASIEQIKELPERVRRQLDEDEALKYVDEKDKWMAYLVTKGFTEVLREKMVRIPNDKLNKEIYPYLLEAARSFCNNDRKTTIKNLNDAQRRIDEIIQEMRKIKI
jgi:hypothetical protein